MKLFIIEIEDSYSRFLAIGGYNQNSPGGEHRSKQYRYLSIEEHLSNKIMAHSVEFFIKNNIDKYEIHSLLNQLPAIYIQWFDKMYRKRGLSNAILELIKLMPLPIEE